MSPVNEGHMAIVESLQKMYDEFITNSDNYTHLNGGSYEKNIGNGDAFDSSIHISRL